jgi:hypothetical protein
MASIINATTSTGLVSSADNSGSLQLATNNGTTAVTIDTSQNVGIGTTSPVCKLNVSSSAATDALIRLTNNNGGVYASSINIDSANLTGSRYNSIYSSNTNTYQWAINGGGADGTMAFCTGSSNTERMRINSSGFVGINNTNPSFLLTASNTGTSPRIAVEQTADVSADMITFRRNGSERGKINITDSATQYQTSSDYRLKENITALTNGLETVAKLKPSSFTWVQERGGQQDTGFIAHELAEVCPNAVTGEKDAVEIIDDVDADGKIIGKKEVPIYQGIDTSFLVATLTAAIQELKVIVDAQAVRIAELEGAK